MFFHRIKPRAMPVPTTLLVFATLACMGALAVLLDLAHLPQRLALVLLVPAVPMIVTNMRVAMYWGRVARLYERHAQRCAAPCVLCERQPLVTSMANGTKVIVTISCPCGLVLNSEFHAVAWAPAFQLRLMGIERALHAWASTEYRDNARKAQSNSTALKA